MAKKSKRSASRKAKAVKKVSKATRKAGRTSVRTGKPVKEVRFIMVLEPALKSKIIAAAKVASKKAGGRISMSQWVRQALLKVLH